MGRWTVSAVFVMAGCRACAFVFVVLEDGDGDGNGSRNEGLAGGDDPDARLKAGVRTGEAIPEPQGGREGVDEAEELN
jgi:hypothetical protein